MQDERRSGMNGSGSNHTQLKQLAVCLVLFLTMWIGKGIFPMQTEALQIRIWNQLTQNINLRSELDRLGNSLQERETALHGLKEFCVSVFGPAPASKKTQEAVQTIKPDSPLELELRFLSSKPDHEQLSQHYIGEFQYHTPVPEPEPQQISEEQMVSAGAVLEVSDYTGEPLPEGCTMDHISLGDLETMTPVSGRLSSPFGYRSHPTSGEHRFHKGADIAADTGTPILAFADGTVEFIGENDSFGQYIQLDHGNGVKSLYAHCSKLCASKGDLISRGDQIALVGSTGDATGPHLHLELKYQNTNLNPAYYVEFV